MVDYEATLKEFFKEIIVFLERRKNKAEDEIELGRIKTAIAAVSKIAENPKQYADYDYRVKMGLEIWPDAFMPTPLDNSVYLIYNRVLYAIQNLGSEYDYYRKGAQETLLEMLRAIKYKNSTNLFKDLTFLFRSGKSFAVKVNQK